MALDQSALTDLLDTLRSGGDLDFMREANGRGCKRRMVVFGLHLHRDDKVSDPQSDVVVLVTTTIPTLEYPKDVELEARARKISSSEMAEYLLATTGSSGAGRGVGRAYESDEPTATLCLRPIGPQMLRGCRLEALLSVGRENHSVPRWLAMISSESAARR